MPLPSPAAALTVAMMCFMFAAYDAMLGRESESNRGVLWFLGVLYAILLTAIAVWWYRRAGWVPCSISILIGVVAFWRVVAVRRATLAEQANHPDPEAFHDPRRLDQPEANTP